MTAALTAPQRMALRSANGFRIQQRDNETGPALVALGLATLLLGSNPPTYVLTVLGRATAKALTT